MNDGGQWTFVDLQGLVANHEEERNDLEFKRCDALRWGDDGKLKAKRVADLTEDVSAMANANGGVIVYGIHEAERVAVKIDDGFGEELDAEQLENLILDNIKPKLERASSFIWWISAATPLVVLRT